MQHSRQQEERLLQVPLDPPMCDKQRLAEAPHLLPINEEVAVHNKGVLHPGHRGLLVRHPDHRVLTTVLQLQVEAVALHQATLLLQEAVRQQAVHLHAAVVPAVVLLEEVEDR